MNFTFPRKAKTKMTAIRLTEEQHEYLSRIAIDQDLSLPETICVFLQAAIEEHAKQN